MWAGGNLLQGEPFFLSSGVPVGAHIRRNPQPPTYTFLETLEVSNGLLSTPNRLHLPGVEQPGAWVKVSKDSLLSWLVYVCPNPVSLVANPLLWKISIRLWRLLLSVRTQRGPALPNTRQLGQEGNRSDRPSHLALHLWSCPRRPSLQADS